MTKAESKKATEYMKAIIDGIDCGLKESGIQLQEMEDEDATLFFHALANLAPKYIYTRWTKKEIDLLDLNHIANRLAFQFTDRPE